MKKYNQFEIFRFIGAISVIIFHTARNTGFYNKIPILFQNGSIWVYFFLVLSGFMLTYSYSDKEVNIKKFYLTRLFKFYPTVLHPKSWTQDWRCSTLLLFQYSDLFLIFHLQHLLF